MAVLLDSQDHPPEPSARRGAAGANTYAGIAEQYDALMLSGYYDYDRYSDALHALLDGRRRVLELGVGTGLVASKMLDRGDYDLCGIDNTEAMLTQARARLGDRVDCQLQDVTALDLGERFDASYWVGGCWYFIDDGGTLQLCSHIPDRRASAQGLARVVAHLDDGGLLAFALQGPHRNYAREMPGGLVYEQQLFPRNNGRFTKRYLILKDGDPVAQQDYDYLVLSLAQAHTLLEGMGMEPVGLDPDRQFFVYRKVRHDA